MLPRLTHVTCVLPEAHTLPETSGRKTSSMSKDGDEGIERKIVARSDRGRSNQNKNRHKSEEKQQAHKKTNA